MAQLLRFHCVVTALSPAMASVPGFSMVARCPGESITSCACSTNSERTNNCCCSRRRLLSTTPLMAGALISSSVFTRLGLAMAEEADVISRFRRSDGAMEVEEIVEGDGRAATESDIVEFNYVCRRSNGYFVYSTVNLFTGESQPVTLSLQTNKLISGLKDVIVGMKPRGKRRALIPPELGYIGPGLEPQPQEFGPRRSLLSHAKEPLLFEVQLLKVKMRSNM